MERYLSIIQVINKGMDLVAGTALVSIMLLTTADVVLRYLGHPILGSYDLVSVGAVFVIGFALPRDLLAEDAHSGGYSRRKDPAAPLHSGYGHSRYGSRSFRSGGVEPCVLGADFFKTGEGTLTLGIPLFPMAYALGFCAFLQCFTLIGDVVRIVIQRRAA